MNKKAICGIVICIALLLCGALYFRPLSLSDNIKESNSFTIQINDFGVRNGEPYIDSTSYDALTDEQKEEIIELLDASSYHRTLKTYVSDGSMEQIGDQAVYIYIYDGDTLSESIYVSDSGQLSVNDRLYQMKNAEQFNERLEAILNG